MKKIRVLAVSAIFCAALTACGSQAVNSGGNGIGTSSSVAVAAPENETEEESAATEKNAEKETTKESTSPEVTDLTDGNSGDDQSVKRTEKMRNAYYNALDRLMEDGILPDGTAIAEQYNDMSENVFAVYDVDGDGRDELLLDYTTTFSADMTGFVFDYDETTGELRTEFREFPLLTFFENGVIKAEWSHSQGFAGDFWPYSLYRYEPDSDSYLLTGMVDAWDKNFAGTDSQNKPFPDEIDKSGTGFVYYIMNSGEYDNSNPVDESVYSEWIDSYVGETLELQIPYQKLTEENIQKIKDGR